MMKSVGLRDTWFLLAIAGFFIPSNADADACRDRFVACVAETGSVPQCSSISRSCTLGNTGEQLDTREVNVTPSLFDRGGKRWIQVKIENPNIHQVTLSNHTETLTCADGSIFTAHLRFGGQILQGEDSIQSAPQVVCLGADFEANTRGTEGRERAAIAGEKYACDPEQTDEPVYDLLAMEGGRIEAKSGSIRIIYDLSGGTAQGLFKALCGEGDLNNTEKRDARIVQLRRLLDEILTEPENAPSARIKTVPTGPRN